MKERIGESKDDIRDDDDGLLGHSSRFILISTRKDLASYRLMAVGFRYSMMTIIKEETYR